MDYLAANTCVSVGLGAGIFLRFPGQWDDPSFRSNGLRGGVYYNVHRWYELGVGRYTRPDPLHVVEANRPFMTAGLGHRWSLYSYVDGNPLLFVDPLGLLKFVGCSTERQQSLNSGLKEYCSKLDQPEFSKCCGKPSISTGLKRLCSDPNLIVQCEPRSDGKCAPTTTTRGKQVTCVWSLPFVRVIHFCPDGWASTCGPVGCTLLHEMTHISGHPLEKWPETVESCLGCS